MKSISRKLLALALFFCMSACATLQQGGSAGHDYLPGGVAFYSAGPAHDKDYFLTHIKRVQGVYSLFKNQQVWADDGSTPAPSTLGMLQVYYPLSVRWELKDGRQFIAENIDIRTIMREYFKSHDLQMQWQRENRPRNRVGDYDPSLVYEVKEDEVIIKWLLTINLTPVSERLTPSGAATLWQLAREQHVVTAVKGIPTSGIDFDKRWGYLK